MIQNSPVTMEVMEQLRNISLKLNNNG